MDYNEICSLIKVLEDKLKRLKRIRRDMELCVLPFKYTKGWKYEGKKETECFYINLKTREYFIKPIKKPNGIIMGTPTCKKHIKELIANAESKGFELVS